jgi:hypothetical protein
MQPNDTVDETQLSRAEQAYEEAMAVNLDEVTESTVIVAIREYADDPAKPGRRTATVRHVELDAYVPMKIFNAMIAGRERVLKQNKLREQALASSGDVNEDDPNVVWMLDCVCRVWKLTEPDMTVERLAEGLDFKKVQALFYHFFGDALSLGKRKALPAGNTTVDSTLSVVEAAPSA